MPETITMWYERYRHWTIKDAVEVVCVTVLLMALRTVLPKIFPALSDRMINGISWGIAIVVMLALIIAI